MKKAHITRKRIQQAKEKVITFSAKSWLHLCRVYEMLKTRYRKSVKMKITRHMGTLLSGYITVA